MRTAVRFRMRVCTSIGTSSDDVMLAKLLVLPIPPAVGMEVAFGDWSDTIQSIHIDLSTGTINCWVADDSISRSRSKEEVRSSVADWMSTGWELLPEETGGWPGAEAYKESLKSLVPTSVAEIKQRLEARWPENQWVIDVIIGPNDLSYRYKILRDGDEIGVLSPETLGVLSQRHSISLETLMEGVLGELADLGGQRP